MLVFNINSLKLHSPIYFFSIRPRSVKSAKYHTQLNPSMHLRSVHTCVCVDWISIQQKTFSQKHQTNWFFKCSNKINAEGFGIDFNYFCVKVVKLKQQKTTRKLSCMASCSEPKLHITTKLFIDF